MICRWTLLVPLMLSAAGAVAAPRPGWLGLSYTYHGNGKAPAIQWLLVRGLEPGGPAEKGGLQLQDVIVGINGRRVAFDRAQALLDALATIRPGDTIRFRVRRGSAERIVTVRATEMTNVQYERWKLNYELASKAPRPRPKR